MTTNGKDDLKKLVMQANEVFDHYRSAGNYSQTQTTYELYTALDYPWVIKNADYLQKFKRQDIANRVINAPVLGTWKNKPRVYETDKKDTKFEKEFEEIAKEVNLYYYLTRLDTLAMLNRYSVLYLGLKDNTDPAIPATKASGISFITPIPEDRATIQTWETDINSPRFGLPTTYSITIDNSGLYSTGLNAPGPSSMPRTVDWTRIIHIAENTLDSDIYGIPFLEPIYNRLIGLEKLAGGSPEMYWRGARPGYIAQSTENSVITDEHIDELKTQLSSFVNNMQRWMYLEGMNVTSLSPQVVSPTDHVKVQLQLISAATRIPVRILTGSERGELSSSQDERAWLSFLEERRERVGNDLILRPFIDRLITTGSITKPSSGEYFIEWEPLVVMSEKDKADIALTHMQTVKTWAEAMGGEDLFPPEYLLKELGKSEEEIELQLSIAKDEVEKESMNTYDEEEAEEDES